MRSRSSLAWGFLFGIIFGFLLQKGGVTKYDVIIGQLLISIVGFGALFELYSANFLMAHFWAVLIVLFALAVAASAQAAPGTSPVASSPTQEPESSLRLLSDR